MKQLSGIGNYYGGLYITKKNNKYYWIVENWDTDLDNISEWQEIPKKLYDRICDFISKGEKV